MSQISFSFQEVSNLLGLSSTFSSPPIFFFLYSTVSDKVLSVFFLYLPHKHSTGNVFHPLFCLSCSVRVKMQSFCHGVVNVCHICVVISVYFAVTCKRVDKSVLCHLFLLPSVIHFSEPLMIVAFYIPTGKTHLSDFLRLGEFN